MSEEWPPNFFIKSTIILCIEQCWYEANELGEIFAIVICLGVAVVPPKQNGPKVLTMCCPACPVLSSSRQTVYSSRIVEKFRHWLYRCNNNNCQLRQALQTIGWNWSSRLSHFISWHLKCLVPSTLGLGNFNECNRVYCIVYNCIYGQNVLRHGAKCRQVKRFGIRLKPTHNLTACPQCNY